MSMCNRIFRTDSSVIGIGLALINRRSYASEVFPIAVYRASALISRGAEALYGSSANQYLSRISLLSAISDRVNGRDKRTLVGDRDGWEPVDEETKNRFADIVSPGALRLDYRAELRNRARRAPPCAPGAGGSPTRGIARTITCRWSPAWN
jgi:hypothetical protein